MARLSSGIFGPIHGKLGSVVGTMWTQNNNDDYSTDDQVMLIIYNRELKIVDGFIEGCNRANLQCSLELNPKLIGKSLDVYAVSALLV